MTNKVKIALAIGMQSAMVGAVGDFVGWPYMKYVFILAGISLVLTVVFFIWDMGKRIVCIINYELRIVNYELQSPQLVGGQSPQLVGG